MREVTLFLTLGIIAAFVNIVLSYVKKWELLWTLTVAAGIMTAVVFLVGMFLSSASFFTSLLAFLGLLSILGMAVVALTISTVQAVINLRKG
ncbi:hypothetical protein [Ferroglobus placidus]|uniref:hypothetical protein n=1 Tax=Ferroglobus placidus TaxID=54261 RepID=UPI0001B75D09|nr:hypothetical protein [Ferroglobus placidus]